MQLHEIGKDRNICDGLNFIFQFIEITSQLQLHVAYFKLLANKRTVRYALLSLAAYKVPADQ